MKRFPGIRRHRPLPEVEARIAALSEELPLTAAFVAAMAREGRPRAAAGVIREQRASLKRAETTMLRALSARRRRFQVVLSAAAAVMMLASGSYATVRALLPATPHQTELIRRATNTLDQASAGDGAAALARIVDDVHDSLLAISDAALADPKVRLDVAKILGRERALLSRIPAAGDLLARVERVAQEIDVEPVHEEVPESEPPSGGAPQAPAAPPQP